MRIPIVVLGLALASSMSMAQPAGGPPDGGNRARMAMMEEKLGLSDEQVAQMREIRDNGGSMAEMHAVLTPEQQAKMAQMRKAHSGDQENRKARMQEYLGLSDEQAAQMAQIRQAGGSREELRAVLTPEQQAKFDAMRKQHKAQGQPPGEGAAE